MIKLKEETETREYFLELQSGRNYEEDTGFINLVLKGREILIDVVLQITEKGEIILWRQHNTIIKKDKNGFPEIKYEKASLYN